jgi:DNA repair protein RecO (recombination protein O)
MDLERVSYASFLLDLTYQVVKQTEEEEIFILLKDTLIKIEEGLNPIALTNILELKLLDYLGVSPSIDACAHCGSDKQIVTLSSEAGGYVCKNCYNNEPLVSEKTIKMIRMYYYVNIPNITKLDVKEETTLEINRFLDDYYDRFTGLYIKSKDFIKHLNQLSQK